MARWQCLRLALLFRVYRFIMVHPCSPERGQRSHQAGALNPPRYRIRCRHLRFSTGARMARSHSAWCCHSGWRVGPGWQDVTWHQKSGEPDMIIHNVTMSWFHCNMRKLGSVTSHIWDQASYTTTNCLHCLHWHMQVCQNPKGGRPPAWYAW